MTEPTPVVRPGRSNWENLYPVGGPHIIASSTHHEWAEWLTDAANAYPVPPPPIPPCECHPPANWTPEVGDWVMGKARRSGDLDPAGVFVSKSDTTAVIAVQPPAGAKRALVYVDLETLRPAESSADGA